MKALCDVCSELCKQPTGSVVVKCKHFHKKGIAPTPDSPKSST